MRIYATTTQAHTVRNALALAYAPEVFRDAAAAFRTADRWVKPGAVILGDDGQYWVVCLADAQRLESAGYEWASR